MGTSSSALSGLKLAARPTALRCAYCTEDLGPVRAHACACGATYHRDCWSELERCGTLGCGRRPTREERARAGRCPGCQVECARAFRWELAACGACGTVYHLGCRARLRRCAHHGCRSGRHDRWAAPAPRALAPRTVLVQLLARAGALLRGRRRVTLGR